MSSEHAGEAFPAAVSRLTALESLALQHLVLLVRICSCTVHDCSIRYSVHRCANHCLFISCPISCSLYG